jgi:hypothetical protein
MQIKIINIWSSNYQPWQITEQPWQTIAHDNSLVVDLKGVVVSTGARITVPVQNFVINKLTPTIKYGVKIIANAQNLTLRVITPKKIGIMWQKIVKPDAPTYTCTTKPTTNWTNKNKPNG